MLIDLHLHTKRSDGSSEPLELLNYILFQHPDIAAVSITDHDTIAAYADVMPRVRDYPFRIITGVEISCCSLGAENHILGYGVDLTNERLLAFLEQLRERRLQRSLTILQRLREIKIHIDPTFLTEKKGTTGRTNIARILVRQGLASTINEAFRLYLGIEAPTYVPDVKPDADEVIDILHAAGGIAVLAHPFKTRTTEPIYDMIRRFRDLGIDGLECYYHSFTPVQIDQLVRIAFELSLIKTGGSDLHDLTRTVGVQVDTLDI